VGCSTGISRASLLQDLITSAPAPATKSPVSLARKPTKHPFVGFFLAIEYRGRTKVAANLIIALATRIKLAEV